MFCNHEKSVSVKLNKKAGVGQLDCRTCGQNFQCPINCEHVDRLCSTRVQIATDKSFPTPDLSAAVDVYAEWVDAAGALVLTVASRYMDTDLVVDAVAAEDEEEAQVSPPEIVRRKEPTSQTTRDEGDDDGGYEGEGIVPDEDDD